MKGLTKTAAGEGHMELLDHPEPRPAPGHVVIEVAAAAICGTDLHIVKGEYAVRPPVVIGHEAVGRVVELGAGVESSWRGRRAVVLPAYSTCGVCPECRDGYPVMCTRRQSIGTHVNGAFAPLLEIPAANLVPVPDWLPDEAAALCEPAACVCNGLFDPHAVAAGDSVLVTGPGPIGLMAAQVARAAGGRVTVRGAPSDSVRLGVAEKLGFAIEVAGADACAPERFEVVIECSGNAHGIADGMRAAKRRARFVQLGICGVDVTIPYDMICYRQLTVSSVFGASPRAWRHTLALVEGRLIDLQAMVTKVGPLHAWRSLFDAAFDKSGLKCVIDPRL